MFNHQQLASYWLSEDNNFALCAIPLILNYTGVNYILDRKQGKDSAVRITSSSTADFERE